MHLSELLPSLRATFLGEEGLKIHGFLLEKPQINLRKKRCSLGFRRLGTAFLHSSGKSKISMGQNSKFYRQIAILFCNSPVLLLL